MMDANCSGGKTSQLKNLILISDSAIVDGGAAKVALQTAKIMNTCDINVTFFPEVRNLIKAIFLMRIWTCAFSKNVALGVAIDLSEMHSKEFGIEMSIGCSGNCWQDLMRQTR